MIQARPQNSGSVLLEALLTIVILSVGLTFIIQALSSSLRTMSLITNYSTALLLAENKMFTVMQKGFITGPLQEIESFSEPHTQYRYELDVRKGSSSPTEKKNEINLQVVWGSGLKEKNLLLTTYFFDTPHEPPSVQP